MTGQPVLGGESFGFKRIADAMAIIRVVVHPTDVALLCRDLARSSGGSSHMTGNGSQD